MTTRVGGAEWSISRMGGSRPLGRLRLRKKVKLILTLWRRSTPTSSPVQPQLATDIQLVARLHQTNNSKLWRPYSILSTSGGCPNKLWANKFVRNLINKTRWKIMNRECFSKMTVIMKMRTNSLVYIWIGFSISVTQNSYVKNIANLSTN